MRPAPHGFLSLFNAHCNKDWSMLLPLSPRRRRHPGSRPRRWGRDRRPGAAPGRGGRRGEGVACSGAQLGPRRGGSNVCGRPRGRPGRRPLPRFLGRLARGAPGEIDLLWYSRNGDYAFGRARRVILLREDRAALARRFVSVGSRAPAAALPNVRPRGAAGAPRRRFSRAAFAAGDAAGATGATTGEAGGRSRPSMASNLERNSATSASNGEKTLGGDTRATGDIITGRGAFRRRRRTARPRDRAWSRAAARWRAPASPKAS